MMLITISKMTKKTAPEATLKVASPPMTCQYSMVIYQNPDKLQVDQVQQTARQ
jgi:hypothetical protein